MGSHTRQSGAIAAKAHERLDLRGPRSDPVGHCRLKRTRSVSRWPGTTGRGLLRVLLLAWAVACVIAMRPLLASVQTLDEFEAFRSRRLREMRDRLTLAAALFVAASAIATIVFAGLLL